MDKKELTRQIIEEAHRLGFSLAGVTTSDPPDHLEFFQNWLSSGYQASMDWMASERSQSRRADPLKILSECLSIISLGIPYADPGLVSGLGGIAAYALNQDYHDVLPEKLESLVVFIEEKVGHPIPNRWYTDTGPILEREMGMRAGLGWIGKNTTLINRELGSFFFLAEILVGIKLEPNQETSAQLCGSCTRCLEACPTGSLTAPYTLDAGRCISYLTIEHREEIPEDLRPLMGEWVFGCDICQAVCPWNQSVEESPEIIVEFQPRRELAELDYMAELNLNQEAFSTRFKGSPVKRTKRLGYFRNLAVALGNKRDRDVVMALAAALQDKEALVRSHAAWALGKIGGENALKILSEAGLELEEDLLVMKEIQRARNKINGI